MITIVVGDGHEEVTLEGEVGMPLNSVRSVLAQLAGRYMPGRDTTPCRLEVNGTLEEEVYLPLPGNAIVERLEERGFSRRM